MRTHTVLAHPERQSFNGHLCDITREVMSAADSTVTVADLYTLGFDPCEGPHHFSTRKNSDAFHAQTEQRFSADNNALPADVEAEVQNLLACDCLVVHFPLWWFGMPAILKGWMDRVFVYGRMYRSVMRYDKGICKGKKMIACVTTGASEDSCSYNGKEGDTQLHLWPLLFPFRYLGFDVCEPEVFHGVGGVAFIEGHDGSTSAIDSYSNRWRETLQNLASRPLISYNRDEEFDDNKRLIAGAATYSPFVRQYADATPKD
ncbi:MAG: NAD(P)H-dependent oxidoreductase [Pseudomonadota bacterium]